MTNGEKIKEIFPNVTVESQREVITSICHFYNDWLNSEYKEPTTKNDLRVDCISRAQTQTEIEMCASRYTIAKERGGMGQVEWSDQLIKVSDAVNIIRELPSVTPQEPILDKIRAEIEKEIIPRNSDQYDHEAMWQNCGLRMALKAINKYKAESEAKDAKER